MLVSLKQYHHMDLHQVASAHVRDTLAVARIAQIHHRAQVQPMRDLVVDSLELLEPIDSTTIESRERCM